MKLLKNRHMGLLALQLGVVFLPAQIVVPMQSHGGFAGNDIQNLRVLKQSADGSEVTLTLEYSYDGSSGSSARLLPVIADKSQKKVSSWFGADPVTIPAGHGTISIKVKFFNDEPGAPKELTTDRVRIMMLTDSGSSVIVQNIFSRTIKWGTPTGQPVETAEEARAREAAEAKHIEEEKARVDAEVKNLAAARAKAEQEKLAAEAQTKAKADAEAKVLEEARVKAEQERLALEAKAKAEAEAKALEAARLKAEQERLAAEAKAKADAEAKAAEEARLKAEQERLAAEAQAKAKAEADARAIEEARLKAEQEKLAAEAKARAVAQAIEEARVKAEQERLAAEAKAKADAEAKAEA
jgi:hypothetical protein